MANAREDVLAIVKEMGDEDKPLSVNSICTQLGMDQKKAASTLSALVRTDPHFHRRKISEFSAIGQREIDMYGYWYNTMKKSEEYVMRQKGLLPKRKTRSDANGAQESPRAAPASSVLAPIFAPGMGPQVVSGFVVNGDRVVFQYRGVDYLFRMEDAKRL